MRTDKEFDNILDECLQRLLVGGETIEQCLERYPEQASQLKPLLETALVVKETSAVQPRAEFKARARYQFRSALQEAAAVPKRRPFFGWLPRWATVVTAVLVLLLAGGGTVFAAASSMPGSPLYPVKLATEQVQLVLTPSQLGKANLCAEFADRRVDEIIYVADRGDARQVELITQRLDNGLDMLAVLALDLTKNVYFEVLAPPAEEAASEPVPPVTVDEAGRDFLDQADDWAELRVIVADYADSNQAALLAALEEVPESVRAALLRAIAVSEDGYEKALEALY
jgi:hypothetical protein